MLNNSLLHPQSIVVVGGSNDTQKPGGSILRNLINNKFKGRLYVTNLKEAEVQGIKSYQDLADLPDTDLAILAIPANCIPETVEQIGRAVV